jgi:hypothetical protein
MQLGFFPKPLVFFPNWLGEKTNFDNLYLFNRTSHRKSILYVDFNSRDRILQVEISPIGTTPEKKFRKNVFLVFFP